MLASGFVLIPAVGLPGTVLFAGLVNIALALLVWPLSKQVGWQTGTASQSAIQAQERKTSTSDDLSIAGPSLLLTVAFATGVASFMYEIGWIRMLSLVLGASTHAFALMLSAFILGLALGSAWVR